MSKKQQLALGVGIAFGGGVIILIMGLLFDMLPFNPYSGVFWMIFLVLIVYFALGAQKKNIPAMIVSFACGLGWGLLSNFTAFLFIRSNHVLFAIINYFGVAGLIVFIHQFIAKGTWFGLAPCAFLGLAESIFVATCGIPNSSGELMPPMTWGPIDLFIIYIIGIIMVTALAFFSDFIAKKIIGKKAPPAEGEKGAPSQIEDTGKSA